MEGNHCPTGVRGFEVSSFSSREPLLLFLNLVYSDGNFSSEGRIIGISL